MAREYLTFAHRIWKELLSPGDLAIDATCGNGHDTLILAQAGARVIAYDIQETAIANTQERTQKYDVQLVRKCHSQIDQEKIKLLVYNLGYLPGGDKTITTQTETTLESIHRAMPKILPGGAITITLYPGHEEGAREKEAILKQSFDETKWKVSHHSWSDRSESPSIVVLQRLIHNEEAAADDN